MTNTIQAKPTLRFYYILSKTLCQITKASIINQDLPIYNEQAFLSTLVRSYTSYHFKLSLV